MRSKRRQQNHSVASATNSKLSPPIATSGEVFADGTAIEVIKPEQDGKLQLLLWNGTDEMVSPIVDHDGRRYEPTRIDPSIVRDLTLPTRGSPHGSTCQLLGAILNLLKKFVGLEDNTASLLGRVVLCSYLLEAISVAPSIVIAGPDITRGNRLMTLLRCLCRHALPLTGVTPAGFCSLPSGAKFSYLITQANLSDKLLALLDDASSRDRKIPSRGRLLDLFGVQIVHCVGGDPGPLRAIQVSMTPTGQELPALDLDVQRRVTDELQAKLLSFRRANLEAARRLQFDASKLSYALRDVARSLAAATPDDRDLQNEVLELLKETDKQVRCEHLVDLSVIAVEAVLVACHEPQGPCAYVCDLVNIAQEILKRRGEGDAPVDAGRFGRRLKSLGFTTERDARGMKLRLTEAVRNRAQQLAQELGVAGSGNNPPAEKAG